MPDIQTKLADLARTIEGRVVLDKVATPICVKGIVSGFPVSLEAIQPAYPFGLSYFIETNHPKRPVNESFKITILPKYARGWVSHVTRFLFFERLGQKMDLPLLDSSLIFKYDNFLAKEFIQRPDVADEILSLEKLANFSEMIIKSDAGLYLSQPISFVDLDLTVCQKVFQVMAKLGQVLFEAY